MRRQDSAAEWRDHAAALDRDAAALEGEAAGVARGRAMLADLAGQCRAVAEVYVADPTLVDEPYGTGRPRDIGLLGELVRQLPALVRHALSDRAIYRQQRAELWDEADALAARAGQLTALIRDTVPRHDHAAPAGSQAISHTRLAAAHHELGAVAEAIRGHLASALALPYPHPQAREVAALADQLTAHATALQTAHEANLDAQRTARDTVELAGKPASTVRVGRR